MCDMDIKYKHGQTVYIVENGHFIRACVVINYVGGMYTIRFSDGNGAIKLRESRLFPTKEAAQSSVREDIRRRMW
ncbi:MAG: hypothetical protein K6G33_01575 [Ruminococcus sp.]|uniref:hypothetical protein n=1 Tax=Ruminococcus sp. TaxID=41978 RepID=UPI0025DDE82E|nr:hypothetical protein [Ruminococcus sp.]MCR5599423.1 hypothetical protein [Ruminococcus sp.]